MCSISLILKIYIYALSVTASPCQPPAGGRAPFVRVADIFPAIGEINPQRESVTPSDFGRGVATGNGEGFYQVLVLTS